MIVEFFQTVKVFVQFSVSVAKVFYLLLTYFTRLLIVSKFIYLSFRIIIL